MSLPDIYTDSIGDQAVADFESLIDKYGDENNVLSTYLHGLGLMLKPVDDISMDGPDGEPGWSQLFDLTRAKTEWLPWTGQLVGYHVPVQPDNQTLEEYDASQRERIITRSAYRRGTAALLGEVVAEQLDPPKRIFVHERAGGDPFIIKVWVYAADIATSEAEIRQAALGQKVAGLIMTFSSLTGADTYDMLNAHNATYQDILDKHANYQSVKDNPDL